VDGHNATGPLQAEYAASDPAVVAVGGTSLMLAPADGAVVEEDGWTSSGGGDSNIFDRPPWQRGAGVPAGNHRSVPDVSIVADPNTGAFLVLQGQPIQEGGTSLSAPVWAGICALTNEARQAAGLPAVAFLNPILYRLLGTAAFRDIRSGSNGAFTAASGYDRVTGIGVPDVTELIRALTAPEVAARRGARRPAHAEA
jgi:kumamolisin